ncbi:MAG: phosphopentomutase [Ruminococcaceae bacterium]|nr:phosphopentomutase [Oscillospiraceae bacterium]
MKIKRVFLVVLDSFGIGEMKDSHLYGDEGSNTLYSCFKQKEFDVPNMKRLGLFNIDGVTFGQREESPTGAYGRFAERSKGKDTTTGHWEIAGIVSEKPFPTYPDGFPEEILEEFTRKTGRGVLCNKPYSGTKVIEDYGKEHLETGKLIVYTSADSVFQIAAHESLVPPEKLYEYCRTAREILKGDHAVGRVIARPFEGEYPDFKRTSNRHDFSLLPPGDTLIDVLTKSGLEVIPIGKIYDIFAGKGLCRAFPTSSNAHGMELTEKALDKDFRGLCFTNLVDFDMHYGHRNDAPGYARTLAEFDRRLGDFMLKMKEDDLLMLTADHGCDPLTESTDHSREYVPLLVYGKRVRPVNLGTRQSFADIGKTVEDIFGISSSISGESFKNDIIGE